MHLTLVPHQNIYWAVQNGICWLPEQALAEIAQKLDRKASDSKAAKRGIGMTLKGVHMKLMAMAVLLLFAVSAKADNIVAVILQPTTFTDLAGSINGQFVDASETVGATFNWNTTTDTMYDFTLFAAGPFWQGIEHLSLTQASVGDHPGILDLFSSQGDLFQLNYSNHGNSIQPALISTPGTYKTDLFLFCSQCTENSERFAIGTATVTATPEPSALLLLIAGLVFVFVRSAIASHPRHA